MKIAKVSTLATFLFAAGAVVASAQTAPVQAPGAAAPAAVTCVAEKMSSDSTVGEILDNPTAKAILINHVPEMGTDDQIEMARAMTLRSLQAYAADTFTDKLLGELDAEFGAIPVCPAGAAK